MAFFNTVFNTINNTVANTNEALPEQRRDAIRCLTVLTASAAVLNPQLLYAQALYPSKPIRLIVGFPPGGGIDFAARAIQPALQDILKQQIVIDYKPGAGGMLAATELVRAAPDGYTLLVANTGPFAIAPYLQAKKPYDPKKDFTYIAQVSEGSYIITLRSDHPANNLKELVAWAKANPAKANFASAGNGTSTHLNGELFNQTSGLDMTHVPYKGSAPAIQDLIGGQTVMLIDAGAVLLPQIKAGKLKALAVTGKTRDPNLQDVPTTQEAGFGAMVAAGFQGIVAPAGLAKDVRDKLSAAIAQVMDKPEVKAKLGNAGSQAQFKGSEAFSELVFAENDKWSAVIKKGAIKLD